MSASITDFVAEHREALGHLKGFKSLVEDLKQVSKNSRRASIDNDTACKRVLAHHYDSIIEQPLAKALKKFAMPCA